jgi:hypothetical protein
MEDRKTNVHHGHYDIGIDVFSIQGASACSCRRSNSRRIVCVRILNGAFVAASRPPGDRRSFGLQYTREQFLRGAQKRGRLAMPRPPPVRKIIDVRRRAISSGPTETIEKGSFPETREFSNTHGRARHLSFGSNSQEGGCARTGAGRSARGLGDPSQAVLLDFEYGRLYAFHEIWPQELYDLTGLLALAAAVLVLTNVLYGRVWWGLFCPQTV